MTQILLDKINKMGDDINDIPVLEKVGVAVSVPDSNFKVKKLSNIFITNADGGNGAFREVIDLLLDQKTL